MAAIASGGTVAGAESPPGAEQPAITATASHRLRRSFKQIEGIGDNLTNKICDNLWLDMGPDGWGQC
jgi:hypothetical protein